MTKQIYKIKNFDSVILVDLTIEKEGYDPNNTKPKSNKYVWVSCRYCGEPNRTKKSKYTMSNNSNAHMKCRIKELKETDCTWTRNDVKEKIKNTLIEKYGVDHSSKIEGVPEKRKKTYLKHFGVDNPSKAECIKEKKRQTCLKNYGAEYPLQNKEIMNKAIQTVRKNYGVDRPAQSEEIKEQVRKNFEEVYGVDNPMKDPDIAKKSGLNLIESIKNSDNERFKLHNEIRDLEHSIWEDLKTMSLSEIAKKHNMPYEKLRGRLYDNKKLYKKFKKTYCYPKTQVENEIAKNIKEFVDCKIERNIRYLIKPYELDIYLPSKKFAIEFNGNLWHSEYFVHKRFTYLGKDKKENIEFGKEIIIKKEFEDKISVIKNKHKLKMQLCEEKGIRLFQIFEHQWEEKKYQILNFIKTILNSNKTKVAGRKCKITNFNAKQFINNNHIQGNTQNVIQYFNLEYENEIVASMTASKHHRGSSDDQTIVLSRLCFKNDINVQGGSSKLFKYFKEWAVKQGYNKIISWSDNCWTQGNIYKVLGFELEDELRPDYFYWDVKNHKKYSKQSQKKSSVNCPEGMTEVEWCHEKGLFKIHDAGKRRWSFKL